MPTIDELLGRNQKSVEVPLDQPDVSPTAPTIEELLGKPPSTLPSPTVVPDAPTRGLRVPDLLDPSLSPKPKGDLFSLALDIPKGVMETGTFLVGTLTAAFVKTLEGTGRSIFDPDFSFKLDFSPLLISLIPHTTINTS